MACFWPERGFLFQLLASLAFASLRARSEGAGDASHGASKLHPSRPSHISALGRATQDMVAVHMLKLYDKYNREGNRPRDGNTVRSFKATEETIDHKILYHFNLSSIQDSELILAATFHFFAQKRWRNRPAFCKRSKDSPCPLPQPHKAHPVHLTFRSRSATSPFGRLLGNLSVTPHRRGTWCLNDITHIVKDARRADGLIVTAQMDSADKTPNPTPSSNLPYILVYANDLAISEPNSVGLTLQRYGPFPPSEEESTQSPNASRDSRVRRETYFSSPSLENNELPEVEYHHYNKHHLWGDTYRSLKPKVPRKERRRKEPGHGEQLVRSQVLSFDEKTMRKARRRQWNEPRTCSRRYLKVDFADIGWSEWIISPKSFDAFYCAGACVFPMPKVVRPSNHATIQSIVKAVGIIPGIPEPCCVPDKMNALSVLFFDEYKNVVLKVYPNMSVETCACR
ncbi:growth/differentiation factor 10-like isoform X1 [Pristis pectinata]|uniref:growth/differentiation factor 10-like isoform X1 n=1 Tax=Pristis pectinata TaxID=685728 RepID=UPI00223E7D87|nr:growth/differentiation factor 10-like isoform X1 [Pristis pectinata]